MNLLFVSKREFAGYAGPTYSMPEQIRSLSDYDNVFWYSLTKGNPSLWSSFSFFHDLTEFPEGKIIKLPPPFCKPDLVIFEGFYAFANSYIRKEVAILRIPYLIIPRGELTESAQKRKWAKKLAANLLFLKRFAKKAAAIQYLTEKERKESGGKWNKRSFVIPNGIHVPFVKKRKTTSGKLHCSFIGRIEPYQKGLDLLIDACDSIKDTIRNNDCIINVYGPDNENKLLSLQRKVKEKKMDDFFFFKGPVFGKEKEAVLLDTDVFLLPSRFEGHPMALIEAMSFGIPCVVTEGSNMGEEILNSEAGWVSSVSSTFFAAELKAMLDNKVTLLAKGTNARRLALQYDWGEIGRKSHSAYCQIINTK